jgi:hypothetical protein
MKKTIWLIVIGVVVWMVYRNQQKKDAESRYSRALVNRNSGVSRYTAV